ncbi:hypothetical protein Cgig2_023552 [Carnegiea gigantea]|uniref:SAM domain-containing protein n=1 Tax=Carnegiea gigantea TaxID=171969 RepID=A0A9Q1JYT5_9CARY|nr:hypothetical protein Cgig2_023552 [Carnegiea gigantea]
MLCFLQEIPNLVAEKQQLPLHSAHRPFVQSPVQAANVTSVIEWLHSLGLGKYEAAFTQQEIDWDSLQWLTEEDLIAIGVTALGPRKKIVQSIKELRKKDKASTESTNYDSDYTVDSAKKLAANRLITDYFSSPSVGKNQNLASSRKPQTGKPQSTRRHQVLVKNSRNGKNKVVPSWCSIPGTPFRVDAFQYLRRDCSHWFLTHFHIDRSCFLHTDYQGLTRSFTYGKIYCSKVTAKLVNAKIGIPWERLQVMPLNEKINIAGVDVTCYDANHCPGAIVILFEPPNGKV